MGHLAYVLIKIRIIMTKNGNMYCLMVKTRRNILKINTAITNVNTHVRTNDMFVSHCGDNKALHPQHI